MIYGWRAKFKAAAAAANGQAPPLPTVKAAPARAAKPRALTPVTFACPHCGGLVTLPTEP